MRPEQPRFRTLVIEGSVQDAPLTRSFGGKVYDRHTSSFSKVTQEIEIKKMRKVGIQARLGTCQRMGKTVYTIYVYHPARR